MKLPLTQEVSGLGAPGDVVEVAGGYGRNYLVPRGLAMRWTRGAENQVQLIKRARSARDIRGLDDAKETAGRPAALRAGSPWPAVSTGGTEAPGPPRGSEGCSPPCGRVPPWPAVSTRGT